MKSGKTSQWTFEEYLKHLDNSRLMLKEMKDKKLREVWDKYGSHYEYPFQNVFTHLVEEFAEVVIAIRKSPDKDKIMKELIDFSNLIDFIFSWFVPIDEEIDPLTRSL